MIYRIVLCAAFCNFVATVANAAIYTADGDFQIISPQTIGDPPILDIKYLTGSSGNAYTNQADLTFGAFGVGSEIRTVSVQSFGAAQDGFQFPITLPDGSQLVVFAVLDGTITSIASGNPVATFTSGRAFVSSTPLVGGLDKLDPSTWTASFLAEFAEYALKPQEDVISGDPEGKDVSAAAASTNVSAANIKVPVLGDSFFLFREDSTAAQDASAVPGGAAGTGGNNFLSGVDGLIPSPFVDSLISTPQQTVSLNGSIGSGFNAADLLQLNTIALAGIGSVFATDLVTPGPGYTVTTGPLRVPLGLTNGDFGATVTGDILVGQQTVPEPSMIVIVGGLFGLFAATRAYRRVR